MIKQGKKFFSTDSDWTTENGDTICIWPGTILPEDQVKDFIEFCKEELHAEATYFGTFMSKGISMLTFTVKDTSGITLRRFQYGIRWWYDAFSTTNGGMVVDSEEDFTILVQKLGLEI